MRIGVRQSRARRVTMMHFGRKSIDTPPLQTEIDVHLRLSFGRPW